jgi:post-segregation antitoxin (ccd killing protein)
MEPFEASRDQLLPPSERDWLERNAEALAAHGKLIAETGLAGEEFDRI